MWLQKEIRLKARPRGFHLIDQEIRAALPELDSIRTGLLHLVTAHLCLADGERERRPTGT